MKKFNILEKIYTNKLKEGKGNKIIRDLLDSEALISKTNDILDILAILGFSKIEWQAYSRSAPLKVIAKWRYEGWPSKCMETGKKINLEKSDWIIARDLDGKYGIKNLDEIGEISEQADYYRHRKKNFPTKLCCQMMKYYLKIDEPSIIHYTKKSNEYGIRIFDGGCSYMIISHCPWCGQLLRLKKK